MIVAKITQEKPLQGFVTEDLQIAIQCQYTLDDWRPLFGIKRGQGRVQLPSCFTLNQDCIDALNLAADEFLQGDDD